MPLPPVFRWLAETGGVGAFEMARTFNCGIGMVLVVPAASPVDDVLELLRAHGEEPRVIGRLVERGDGEAVRMDGLATAWAL